MATCSPSDLLEAGKCFQCLTKKELQIVIAQLLCEINQGGGESEPLIYHALISQVDTDAPIAIVLKNTLSGTPVWTRNNTGIYTLTLTGAFPPDQTAVEPNVDVNWAGAFVCGGGWDDPGNSIRFLFKNMDGVNSDINSSDARCSIKISVYP